MRSFYHKEYYSEYAVLGSLLTDNDSWNEIGDYLQANDFGSHFHREIYRAIEDLLMNKGSADVICLAEYLLNEKIVHDDPFLKLCEIINSQFTSKNIKYYAEIVKQKSIDRKMITTAQDIIVSVHEQKADRLDYAQQKFADIANEIPSEILLAADIMKLVINRIDERSLNQSDVTGISTGFIDIDKITYGLHGGDLIILAGRPAMGKTLLAMNIVEHVTINEKKSVVIFSLEMSRESLLERSLSSVGKITSSQIRTGKLSESDYKKISSVIPQFQQAKLFIDDRSFLRVSDIRATCRRIQREHGLSLIVIDYISLMSGDGENETLRITNISRGLKLLARDLNIPIIAISQLNRSVEQRNNKRPCMADLRQSGAIEQDADLIWFIYRDEVYDLNSLNKGMAEVIIAKHRNGSIGAINLNFDSNNCRFDNYSETLNSNQKFEKTWSGKSLLY
jgi:replicative DNA helicase